MAVAPFIRPLQTSGGTFYTFSSAAEHVGLTFNNSSYKFSFSQYVLLNIPNIANPTFSDNLIQFDAIQGTLLQGLSADNNINLAQSLQNYLFNLESIVISQPAYDRNQLQTTAERCFFKWLKEIGAIRYQAANSMESTTNQLTNPRFVEADEVLTGPDRYYRVVQYIGEIDIVNSVQNNVNAYTEVYIHVPTNDGNTPLVLFQTTSDVNYAPSMIFQNLPANPLNTAYLNGRNYYDVNPSGLSILAFYDQAVVNAPTSMFYDTTDDAYDIPENWYDPLVGPNAYFTDANFTDTTVDMIQLTYGLNTITYQRPRLDGVGIDFNPLDYKPIVDNPSLVTIEQYNSTVDAQPFTFNAVLIYYDVTDTNNPSVSATNLYGILFLNDVEQDGAEYGIPGFQKYVPSVVTKLNGNSYGFKLNLKFDTSVDNVGVEQAINDYSTFSLEMFIDAMNVVQNTASILNAQTPTLINLQNTVNNLQNLVLNTSTVNEIDLRLTNLETNFSTNQALFNNTGDIMALINKNAASLAQVLAGQTSIEVSYNLNAIKQGSGIFVDTTVPNQVTINNTVQDFTITKTYPYFGDLSSGGTITLQPFTNYYRHSVAGATLTASNDVYVKIDDSLVAWQKGQVLRLVFDDVLQMGTFSLIVQTDSLNKFGNGTYGVFVAAAAQAQFALAGGRPIFDIVCVSNDLVNGLVFVLDQIR
jgi:hypothetical protein